MNFETGQTAGGPPVRELLQRLPAIGVGHVGRCALKRVSALKRVARVPPACGPWSRTSTASPTPRQRRLREAAPPLGLDASLAERRGADRAGRQGASDDPPDRRHAQVSRVGPAHLPRCTPQRAASRTPSASGSARPPPRARARPPRCCGTISLAWTLCSWFGSHPVGLRLLEATRSGAGDGLVPCPASPSRSWPIPCQMCLS